MNTFERNLFFPAVLDSTRFGGGRVGQGDSRGDCLIAFHILLAVEIVSTL